MAEGARQAQRSHDRHQGRLGDGPGKKGLSAAYIEQAVEASLKRLGVETIDLYLSHWPDDSVPHAETLGAYQRLIARGKIRWCGASNFSAAQLSTALEASRAQGLPRYEVLQPEYNLYDRSGFEGALLDLCVAEEIGVVTYYSLAKGFLAGKYRTPADLGQSPRGGGVRGYLNPRGLRIVDALASVASRHGAKSAEVALAWVIAQPGVTAPIASATTPAQVDSLIRAATLALSADELAALDSAAAPGA
jgi:aryl-alcohol dehydrogenase-like predicted oxidoreductase